jgi:cytochrome c oxidase subunit 3
MSLRALEATSGHGDSHAHQTLSVQFESLDQQNETYIVGMWSFLVTEIMFFGALFLAYTLYRVLYFDTYLEAHQFLLQGHFPLWGTINTFVLLTSSLTMVLAVDAGQKGKRNNVLFFLSLTGLCALGFLGVKYIEYTNKLHEGLFPDTRFNYARALYLHHEENKSEGGALAENPRASRAWEALQEAKAAGATLSEEGLEPAVALNTTPAAGLNTKVTPIGTNTLALPYVPASVGKFETQQGRARLFFSLYFSMTGLHGLHILIGIGLMAWIGLGYFLKLPYAEDYMPLEMIGLYWHFVDLVWIFLFPLMYLIS